MPVIAWIIALIATFENFFPYLVGIAHTPPGAIFLGTVHHPSDYFYYVSQFAQGAYRWISSIDLFTAEPVAPTLVGWSNVILGHLFGLFGLSPIEAYQGAIALFTFILFFAAYHLIYEIVQNKRMAVIALYLFVLYHAFPITRNGHASYGDYFNNVAIPRVRFGAVPHQLLLAAASIYLVYGVMYWLAKRTNHSTKLAAGIAISSIMLASLQPVLWVLTLTSIWISAIIYIFIQKDKKPLVNTFFVPIFWGTISGIIPIIYLAHLFQTLPFAQLKVWEAAQQTSFTFRHFISAAGPIFLVAISSLPWYIKRPSFPRLFITTFAFASFTLFLSPIPITFGLSHVRFMSTLTILSVSIIAADGIHTFSSFFASCTNKFLHSTFLILALLTLYLVPNHFLMIQLASEFSPTNAYHYLARGDYDLLKIAAQSSNPNDTFLIIWPFNSIFPAISGRKSYNGHSLLTINAAQKDTQAALFFDNKMTDTEVRSFIKNNRISHIITYTWTKLPQGLTILLATKGSLSLYEVNQAYLKPYSK